MGRRKLENRTPYTATILADVLKQLDEFATKNSRTRSDVIEEAVAAYLLKNIDDPKWRKSKPNGRKK